MTTPNANALSRPQDGLTTPAAFSAADFDDPAKLCAILEEITADPSLVDRLPEAELIRLEKYISPYGQVPEAVTAAPAGTPDDKRPHVCLSFTNLRQEYMKKFVTTSMVGYLYRRCDEYGRQFGQQATDTIDYMDDMKVAEAQVIANQARQVEVERDIIETIRRRDELAVIVTRDTAIEAENRIKYAAERATLTKPEIHVLRDFASALTKASDDLRLANKRIIELEGQRDAIQGFGKRFIIRQFLDEQFRFNPDKHVRSSYVGGAKAAAAGPTAYAARFVPPDDFFHNYTYYADSNFEELREVAGTLYKMKPDLEVAIIPYGEFANKDEADKFIERNKTATIADIRALCVGKWGLIEAFKANRDRIDAYRGTIVDDILQQVKSDTKLGAELVKKRVTDKRVAQVKQHGVEPKQVRAYMEAHASAEAAGIVSSSLSEDEQKRLHTEHQEAKAADEAALLAAAAREDPAPHDTLRVNVYKFAAGGAELQKSHFFTESVAPDPNAPPKVGV